MTGARSASSKVDSMPLTRMAVLDFMSKKVNLADSAIEVRQDSSTDSERGREGGG